tara:strand:- start:11511 stop:11834 length:324 start_codon:yes stop_codon:yes gene_type:complete
MSLHPHTCEKCCHFWKDADELSDCPSCGDIFTSLTVAQEIAVRALIYQTLRAALPLNRIRDFFPKDGPDPAVYTIPKDDIILSDAAYDAMAEYATAHPTTNGDTDAK